LNYFEVAKNRGLKKANKRFPYYSSRAFERSMILNVNSEIKEILVQKKQKIIKDDIQQISYRK
jgi:hypothetical protein